MFLESCPLLGCQICWHITVYSIILWYFVFLLYQLRFLFYFLILFIGVFSPFFLVCLDRGLSILFTLLRNQLVVLLIFKYIFKFSILFTSSLIFIISFLLLTSGFVCSSLSNSFRWNNFRSYQIFLLFFFFEESLYELPSKNCFCCIP